MEQKAQEAIEGGIYEHEQLILEVASQREAIAELVEALEKATCQYRCGGVLCNDCENRDRLIAKYKPLDKLPSV